MSIGGKKDGTRWYDLLSTVCIGVVIIAPGMSVATDRLYYTYIYGFIDFGRYHFIIGIATIGAGAIYLFLALKGYLIELSDE